MDCCIASVDSKAHKGRTNAIRKPEFVESCKICFMKVLKQMNEAIMRSMLSTGVEPSVEGLLETIIAFFNSTEHFLTLLTRCQQDWRRA